MTPDQFEKLVRDLDLFPDQQRVAETLIESYRQMEETRNAAQTAATRELTLRREAEAKVADMLRQSQVLIQRDTPQETLLKNARINTLEGNLGWVMQMLKTFVIFGDDGSVYDKCTKTEIVGFRRKWEDAERALGMTV